MTEDLFVTYYVRKIHTKKNWLIEIRWNSLAKISRNTNRQVKLSQRIRFSQNKHECKFKCMLMGKRWHARPFAFRYYSFYISGYSTLFGDGSYCFYTPFVGIKIMPDWAEMCVQPFERCFVFLTKHLLCK